MPCCTKNRCSKSRRVTLSHASQPEMDFLHSWAVVLVKRSGKLLYKGKDTQQYNLVTSRDVKKEKATLPVDLRRQKTFLLKLPLVVLTRLRCALLQPSLCCLSTQQTFWLASVPHNELFQQRKCQQYMTITQPNIRFRFKITSFAVKTYLTLLQGI